MEPLAFDGFVGQGRHRFAVEGLYLFLPSFVRVETSRGFGSGRQGEEFVQC